MCRVCERRGRACAQPVVAKASRSRVYAAKGVLPKEALSTAYTLKAYNQNQTKGEPGRQRPSGGRLCGW